MQKEILSWYSEVTMLNNETDDTEKSQNSIGKAILAFPETLFMLLMKKPYEEITVDELCEISNYPCTIFHNYFEDIEDLLNYCFFNLCEDMHLEDCMNLKLDEMLYELFGRIYDYFYLKTEILDSLLKFNQLEGKLNNSFQKYMRALIRSIMKNCNSYKKYPIPFEMVAEHYSNTLQLVIENCFFKKERYSKEIAIEYLLYFIGS